MNPDTWTLVVAGVLVPLVGVFVLWLKHKFHLSDEAADAVSAGGPGVRPKDTDQAITTLAIQVGALSNEVTEMKVAFPQFVAWGKRGWLHAAPELREPMPPLPTGFNTHT